MLSAYLQWLIIILSVLQNSYLSWEQYFKVDSNKTFFIATDIVGNYADILAYRCVLGTYQTDKMTSNNAHIF